jgi:FHS family glucose/mannose:H+ symporter-like MFS transporter
MITSDTAISSSVRIRQVVILTYSSFLLIGVMNTFLGPALPVLSSRWQLNDSQAGSLFFAQFMGSLIGSAASGWLIRRLSMAPLLIAGYGLLSVSVALLGISEWIGGIFAIFAIGIGLGFTIPATNLMIAESNPERSAGALNLLNFVWGIGALLCPPLISFFDGYGQFSGLLFGLALLLAITSLGLVRGLSVSSQNGRRTESGNASAMRAWISPYALLTGLLIFIYVGIETSVGGWLASYTKRLGSSAQQFWAITPSLFWAGLLLGRALAPAALRIISDRGLVLASLIAAVCGLSLILASRELAALSAGAFITGLGLAPVFPTTFAIFTRHFGTFARNMAGVLFMLAALGAAVVPWIVGVTSKHYDELRIGLGVPLLGALISVALQIAIILILKRRVTTKITKEDQNTQKSV